MLTLTLRRLVIDSALDWRVNGPTAGSSISFLGTHASTSARRKREAACKMMDRFQFQPALCVNPATAYPIITPTMQLPCSRDIQSVCFPSGAYASTHTGAYEATAACEAPIKVLATNNIVDPGDIANMNVKSALENIAVRRRFVAL
jgi:hypothetical protein